MRIFFMQFSWYFFSVFSLSVYGSFENFSTCSIVIWLFQENICTQQIQGKLLELCISRFFPEYFFSRIQKSTRNSTHFTRNIDNTGSFSQFYLLFRAVFLLLGKSMLFQRFSLSHAIIKIFNNTIHLEGFEKQCNRHIKI